MAEFEQTTYERVVTPESVPGFSVAVARCFGSEHKVASIKGEYDEDMVKMLPNLYSYKGDRKREEFYLDIKLESKPKEGKACSGDFVGAAVIHNEDAKTPPQTTIVLAQVDSLSDKGIGWEGEINPDGDTAIKIAEAFHSPDFLTSAHYLAQGLGEKQVNAENGNLVRDRLVTQLSSALIKSEEERDLIPNQRHRAIYAIWLIAPRYDGKGTIDWAMIGSKADIEAYRGRAFTEKSGDTQFGFLTGASKLLGNNVVDQIDQFAERAGLDSEQTYKFKVGYSYDVIGPFPQIERGEWEFRKGRATANLSALLCSDGLARNSGEMAKKIVTGKIDILRPNPLLKDSYKDDSSYAFVNIGVY